MKVTEESLKSRYSQKEPDELLELYQSGKLSDAAYSVIESVMRQRGLEIPNRPEQYSNIQTNDPLKQYWSGAKTIKSAFWVISIAGSIAAIFLAYALANLFKMPYTKLAIYSAITGPYFVILSTVLWRCSKGSSARLLRFIGLLALSVLMTIPFYMYALIALNR